MISVAQDDELRSLRARTHAQSSEIEDKKAALQVAELGRQEFIQLQELHRLTKEALANAERECKEAKDHASEQHSRDQELLQRLLSEQREKTQMELVDTKRQVATLTDELKQARQEMNGMHKELSHLKAAAKLAAQKKEKQQEKSAPISKNKLVLSGDANTPLSEQVQRVNIRRHGKAACCTHTHAPTSTSLLS